MQCDDASEARVPHEHGPGSRRVKSRCSPRRPNTVLDLSPSAVMHKNWNGSATLELDLSSLTSPVFYFEVKATGLHDLAVPSVNGTDIGATLMFALSSLTTGKSIFVAFSSPGTTTIPMAMSGSSKLGTASCAAASPKDAKHAEAS